MGMFVGTEVGRVFMNRCRWERWSIGMFVGTEVGRLFMNR